MSLTASACYTCPSARAKCNRETVGHFQVFRGVYFSKVQPKYKIIIPFCYDTGLAVLTTSPSSTTRDSIGHLFRGSSLESLSRGTYDASVFRVYDVIWKSTKGRGQSRWNYRTPLLFLVSLFFFDIVLARNSEIQGKTGACRLDDYPCLFGAGNGRGL